MLGVTTSRAARGLPLLCEMPPNTLGPAPTARERGHPGPNRVRTALRARIHGTHAPAGEPSPSRGPFRSGGGGSGALPPKSSIENF